MITTVERGRVKFFDSREEKQFGFVHTNDGEELFFHFGDGAGVQVGLFCEPDWTDSSPERFPRKGDEIVFVRQHGRRGKGDKCSPWTFASDYGKVAAFSEEVKHTQRDWAEPWLVVFKRSFATDYYPSIPGCWENGLTIKKHDELLVYKTKTVEQYTLQEC